METPVRTSSTSSSTPVGKETRYPSDPEDSIQPQNTKEVRRVQRNRHVASGEAQRRRQRGEEAGRTVRCRRQRAARFNCTTFLYELGQNGDSLRLSFLQNSGGELFRFELFRIVQIWKKKSYFLKENPVEKKEKKERE